MSNYYSPKKWIKQIFYALQVNKGGIVRRKIKSVLRYASEAQLVAAVKARGFHMVRSGDQFVIFCNQGEFQIIA